MFQFFASIPRWLDALILNAAKWFNTPLGHVVLAIMALYTAIGVVITEVEAHPEWQKRISVVLHSMPRRAIHELEQYIAWKQQAWKDGDEGD